MRHALAACGLLLALLGGCAAPPPASPTPAPLALGRRTLDLTHVLRQDMPYPPGEPAARLLRDADGHLTQLMLGTNSGTLLRVLVAPGASALSVEQLAPRDLLLPTVMLDLRDRAQDTPGFQLDLQDVYAWEQRHGPIPAGALVLLATGWDVRWGDPAAYLDGPPLVSAAVADLLFRERGVAGLGIDAPGPLPGPANGTRLALENLTGLEQLPPSGAMVLVGALRLQAAQSSPARVVAFVP